MSLSMFAVVKDAARLLPALVSNMHQVADEIVIAVDTDDPADATVRQAQLIPDINRVLLVHTGGSYESALNITAAACHGDWIMYLHDDELMPPSLIAELPAAMSQPLVEEWIFERKHIMSAGNGIIRWATNYPLWPDPQVRMRQHMAWRKEPWPSGVHSVPPGKYRAMADNPLWHLKFVVKSHELRKQRYEVWREMPGGADPHFKVFSLPNESQYTLQIAAEVATDVPAEFEEQLRVVEAI
jgi:hypothetical protein